MPRDWVIPPRWPQRSQVADPLRVSPVVAQVLFNRGVERQDDIARFLNPKLADLHPPEAVFGVEAAAERLWDAVRRKRKIVLYGDYDVDGVTGVAILWHCLRLAGAEPDFYIPHRLEEGYGLNPEAIASLADQGAELIVTVDCGITAIESADLARRRGIELVITDHHSPNPDEDGQPMLPKDTLLVHPALGEGPPVNPHLSGSGVAFKLGWAIAQRLSGARRVNDEFKSFLVSAMGLAALGIIADVVPLTGENRILAYHGLRGLPASPLPGVAALIKAAGLTGETLTGYDIGFRIAPRLNAIGRMGHARLAVELLTRADADEARRIAGVLEKQNSARRALERRITSEARAMVNESGQASDSSRAIVLDSRGWHAGVIGVVAARLVEEFGRPTVLIAVEDGQGQGSARGIPGFALHEALVACGDHLTNFGGHAMAAGLRIVASEIPAFREAFRNYAAARLTAGDLRRKLRVDDVVSLGELDEKLVRDLARLEPFGCGNPPPRLATDWLDVIGDPRPVGSGGEHLQLVLADRSGQRKAIAFGQAKYRGTICDHRRCRVAFEPVLNQFNGRRSVELQVVDFQFPRGDANDSPARE